MHEYSVIASLLELCMEQIRINHATNATNIIISVGERSNIEKSLLISAFDILKVEYDELSHAEITIITEQVSIECNDCKQSFHNLENPTCPFCKSENTFIAKGRDIKLESIELEIK
ncbi:hydrogenase/urease nickel incorporation protein HypA [Helicobacter didelphidarum]|uniref:Hydrogenase maturation factor HypA n=1 Tax=Helicobacter didelphidarum TaxID=2040648 RepID=A0A3D8IQI2_9HELI|nr:hydrogenase/urease maturation nickel metallochaperone HypA [Helicobacter didelphidarum]RDU67529.1 hydrogenase/urease nickel incorporation protein HypA [Helicobacter didelphidarum]